MSAEAPEQYLEARCPLGAKALLAKLKKQEDFESINFLRDVGTVQLNCRDCTKHARAKDSGIKRVVHEYNIFGELVQSLVIRD